MTSDTDRIATIARELEAARLSPADAAAAFAAAAEHRGGLSGRRSDGAYFTDADVARWLARRAILGLLLEEAGVPDADVEVLLAHGGDQVSALVARVADDPRCADAVAARLGSIRVLDPTCGAGSFLVAALEVLVDVRHALGREDVALDGAQLTGVDIDPDARAACAKVLELELAAAGVPGRVTVLGGDAEAASVLPQADVVIGNPPFVRAGATAVHGDLATAPVGNRAAWIVERSLAVGSPGARIAFVLPVSVACTSAFVPVRNAWSSACDVTFAAHFDTVPAALFADAVQRVTLLEGRARVEGSAGSRWYTTRYHRWLRSEREGLLDRVRFVPLPGHGVDGSIAKVGTPLETHLLDALFAHPPAGRWHAPRQVGTSANAVLYKRRWSYFLLFTDFVPGIWDADGALREPTELKTLYVRDAVDARVLLAAYSSSLFWWYFSVFTDNRNVNRRDLAAFPIPDLQPGDAEELAALADELMVALRACSELRTCTYRSIGTITNTYFRQGATRPVVDRIDRVLVRAYGLSAEQLEFVLGFERRFRS
ncbi:MAG: hypothetical protein JWM86_2413 [Thermoleophilia bacterium]|nr:hypothetical protein [Thermoleophilia bacterium]